MGGVINVYTLSPFTFEGVRLGMEYGSGNTQKYRISTYYKTSERVGFSVGAYYSKTDGFFKNLYTGEKCDWERSGGGRFKVQYRNLHGLRIDNTFSFVVRNRAATLTPMPKPARSLTTTRAITAARTSTTD